MTYYISTSKTIYSPINKKAEEIQNYVKDYIYSIFDKESLDNFIDDVREKSAELDKDNKRSLPMVVLYESLQLTVFQKDHPDKVIFFMNFQKVRKIIRYKKEFDITI